MRCHRRSCCMEKFYTKQTVAQAHSFPLLKKNLPVPTGRFFSCVTWTTGLICALKGGLILLASGYLIRVIWPQWAILTVWYESYIHSMLLIVPVKSVCIQVWTVTWCGENLDRSSAIEHSLAIRQCINHQIMLSVSSYVTHTTVSGTLILPACICKASANVMITYHIGDMFCATILFFGI